MPITEKLSRDSLSTDYGSSRVRVGVVLDSPAVPRWIQQILVQLDRATCAELVLIVNINRCEESAEPPSAREMPVLFDLWRRLDRRVFQARSMHSDTFDLSTFTAECSHPQILDCRLRDSNKYFNLQESDLQTIKRADLDVLVDLSGSVCRRQLQECIRYGVWFFEETDDLLISLYGDFVHHTLTRESGVKVQLGGRDIGTVPCACSAIDPLSLFRTYSNLCSKRSTMLLQALNELNSCGWRHIHDSLIRRDTAPVTKPSNLGTANLGTRLLLRAATQQVRARFFHEQWFVAFKAKHVPDKFAGEGSLTILHPPHDRFYADPFVIDRGDKSYIFFEDFSYRKNKAVISFVEIDASGRCSTPELVLEEACHLSYPFLLKWEGEIYLIPETKTIRTVQLYRATQFPRGWQLVKVLLSDVAAVDSTVFHHHGKFWLFTSGIGTADPWFNGHSELFLFYSNSLLGPFTPHPRNPVVSDVRRSRAAGQIFWSNGQLIRPAQDYSVTDSFAVTLNLIDTLSEREYHETAVATLPPTWMKGNIGTHTFNRSERYEVIDGRTLAGPMSRRRSRPTLQTVRLTQPLIHDLAP